MAFGYVVALRNTRLANLSALIDAGASGGLIEIYDGTRPATGGATTTLLATLTFSTTSFGTPAAGAMTANAITDDSSADATGTATWVRVLDSDSNFVTDADVGTAGSDLNLNTTSITAGANVSITSWVMNHGNA